MPLRLVVFPVLVAVALTGSALAQEVQPSANDHMPPVSAKVNALAHRVLQAGVKINALAGNGTKPWHLKIDYQLLDTGNPKLIKGAVEEWYAGPYQWRRTYTGVDPRLNGSEWSVSKTEQYLSKPGREMFSHYMLILRVTRPVTDPLYQAANIQPDYEMDIRRVNTAGITLNCVSVVNSARYIGQTNDFTDDRVNPEWLFPTMCFDNDYHLRLTTSSGTNVQLEDVQLFQGRAVARDVKVIDKGNLIAEMKVSVLEAPATVDAALIKPPKDAVPEPYQIEPGFPKPESVYEVGAHVPLRVDGFPYTGVLPVPITIQKDGSVKVRHEGAFFQSGALVDAIALAVNKWKFKPYIVDGQPVEIGGIVGYNLDEKPFVPSYDRPKPAPVTSSPEDYSSVYDPKRDPAKDLAMAETAAAQAHKRILLEVGGNWCSWCKILDKFIGDHGDVRESLRANFVLMKVNMSPSNDNAAFLSQYPAIPGYPFLFVLDSNGKLLTAQNTDPLEDGSGYSANNVKDFLAKWKPQ